MISRIKRFLVGLFDKVIFKISSSANGQNFLECTVERLEYFMGIGAGSDVVSSGEKVAFSKVISNSPVIFDVGANKGQFASEVLAFFKMQNKPIKVYSFEPSKSTYEELVKNINDPCHHAFNFALGKVNGVMNLYSDAPGSGMASLTKRNLDFVKLKMDIVEPVNVQRLDEFCIRNSIPWIDLLKIDVEGHELDVLLGSLDFFDKIEIILFEFGGTSIDTKLYFKDYFIFFSEMGRKIFRITPSGFIYEIKSYNEIYEKFRTTNFLVLKDTNQNV